MWNKVYLGLLAASTLLLGILMYLSYGWLKSIGAPLTVIEKYNYYSNINWLFLWISTLVLLLMGNVVLWKMRKSWALWTTLLYFVFFVVLQTFWLEQSFFHFKQENISGSGGFSFSPFFGIALIVLAAIIVFFNQFIVKRLNNKMFPPVQQVESLPEEPVVDEKNV